MILMKSGKMKTQKLLMTEVYIQIVAYYLNFKIKKTASCRQGGTCKLEKKTAVTSCDNFCLNTL